MLVLSSVSGYGSNRIGTEVLRVPRPNPPREVFAERHLAARVGKEREQRGWSYEGLAERMALAGCPIQASGIYKIEKADPPRRITVDELVAFSKVFELPVAALLADPELGAPAEAVRLFDLYVSQLRHQQRAHREIAETLDELGAVLDDHPSAVAAFRKRMEQLYPDDPIFRETLDKIMTPRPPTKPTKRKRKQ
jgi:transcriptional regulator with XRE-family HTH domain